MRSILILSLLGLSLFPACKRNNEHTQSCARVTKCQKKQTEALHEGACELVDRSRLKKGAACLVGAPTVLGAGAGLSYSVLVGPGCCVPGAAAVLIVAGITCVSVAGAVFLLCKGGAYLMHDSCLAQHARANKERERRRKAHGTIARSGTTLAS